MSASRSPNSSRSAWAGRISLLVVLLGLASLLLYRNLLPELASSILHREDASHGVFIPIISGYLVWHGRQRIQDIKPSYSIYPGLLTIAGGLTLALATRNSEEVFLPALSFLLVAVGLVIAILGKQVFKELAFPICFLATMFPIPKGIYEKLAEAMRMSTTSGSVWLLQLCGFPIYREGYSISMANIDLFVAMACSGIRYLIPYFVFGLAYAYLTRSTLKSRILLVLATVPLAILAGTLRQTSVFLSAYYIGPFMAEHRPHVMTSWAVFVSVLAAAIWLDHQFHPQTSHSATPDAI